MPLTRKAHVRHHGHDHADCPLCGAELCDAPHVESCNVKDPDEAPLMSQAEIDKDAATGRGYEGLVSVMETSPTPNEMGDTLKALYDEARAARDATNDNSTWDYLDRRCSKLAREIDDFMRGRDNAIQAGERVWYFGGWYQRRPSTQYPFRVEQWDAYDGVHHYLVDTAERAKSLIEERFAYARRGQ